MDVFPSRTFRAMIAWAFVGCAVFLAGGVIRLFAGEGSGARTAFELLLGLWLFGYYSWMAYCSWRRPVLHLDPTEIRWRPTGALRPRRMLVSEVTGFRWPAPADLWIEGRGGTTLRMAMVAIGRFDRGRARAWLSDRWVDGGFVAKTAR